jgi:hypothetical protein
MPTGYTSKLYDGEEQTFPEFAMGCARAFGALIMMRDAAPDAQVPDSFAASNHHADAVEAAEDRLAKAQSWTEDEAYELATVEYDAAVKRHAESLAKDKALEARYTAMLAEVEVWKPPTADHEQLKSFMREQLEGSIRFDCGHDYPAPRRLSGQEYRAEKIAEAVRSIGYHDAQQDAEIERTNQRNGWVASLRESLDSVTA